MMIGSLRTRSISTPACSLTQRERQRLERDQHAHLHRRRVQHHRGGQRQREIGDLRAERRDRQRRPQLHEIRTAPEAAEGAGQCAANVDMMSPDPSSVRQCRTRAAARRISKDRRVVCCCRFPPAAWRENRPGDLPRNAAVDRVRRGAARHARQPRHSGCRRRARPTGRESRSRADSDVRVDHGARESRGIVTDSNSTRRRDGRGNRARRALPRDGDRRVCRVPRATRTRRGVHAQSRPRAAFVFRCRGTSTRARCTRASCSLAPTAAPACSRYGRRPDPTGCTRR